MTARPLLLPLLGMMTGLASAHHFSLIIPDLFLPLLLAASLGTVFLRSRIPFALLLAPTFFVWGSASLKPFLTPSHPLHHLVRSAPQEPVIVEGVVCARPEVDGTGSRLIVEVERFLRDGKPVPATGRLLVFIREGRGGVLTGDRVRFETRIRQPLNFGLPGEFDYRRHLAYREIFATASVRSADDILLMREAVAYPVQRWFDRLAAELGNFIGSRFPAEGGVLRAILVGERGYVSDGTEDAYARAGVNHILSISGFHVGVIALTIHYLLLCLLARSEFLALRLNLRHTVLVATLPPVVFYLFLAGLAPATVRSVVMIVVVTLAFILERETDPLNTLMVAAFGILMVTPQALFDISFQLSFLAIWGMLLLIPLCMEPFSSVREGVTKKLLLFVAASAAATMVTMLPVVHTFHRASVAGLIGNFVAVPLLGYGAVVAGFAALPLISVLPGAAEFLLGVAAWFVRVSDGIITVVARIPPLPVRSVTLTDLVVLYLALLALSLTKGTRTQLALCTGSVGLILMLHLPAQADSPSKLTVTFFSVGQGESTLITFPDGKRMLVDGGGSLHEGGMDVGERLLAPALWSLGVDRLDVVVLTHPHPDHIKGLVSIASQFPIGEFWESGVTTPFGDHGELRAVLAERGVPVRRITSSSPPLAIGAVRIEPLAPAFRPPAEPECDQNDDSLVFTLEYGNFSMLFTGDIGRNAEERLLADPAKLRCTVLKVPHHGSRHSSSPRFLDAVSPRLALISAGVRNSFGLPSPETLSRLQERGVAVCRTDLNGTIEVASDGTGYTVQTFSGGHFH
ncbi:DNA internalization-related competence protein ComEC/Rec2 [Geobacter sp.]|uniref:DNA internalization-related competence protein ComEC/Rec2 n=1 Tax=Geobacter sp. TaxID=46610 RepID=UPI0027B9934E|nr:DNA internalization-related competence protein ComEC/Rec2 [Geobacter sp.]